MELPPAVLPARRSVVSYALFPFLCFLPSFTKPFTRTLFCDPPHPVDSFPCTLLTRLPGFITCKLIFSPVSPVCIFLHQVFGYCCLILRFLRLGDNLFCDLVFASMLNFGFPTRFLSFPNLDRSREFGSSIFGSMIPLPLETPLISPCSPSKPRPHLSVLPGSAQLTPMRGTPVFVSKVLAQSLGNSDCSRN